MADNTTLMSDTQYGLQLMVDMGLDYSLMELYHFQPEKSVVLAAQHSKPKSFWLYMEVWWRGHACGRKSHLHRDA